MTLKMYQWQDFIADVEDGMTVTAVLKGITWSWKRRIARELHDAGFLDIRKEGRDNVLGLTDKGIRLKRAVASMRTLLRGGDA